MNVDERRFDKKIRKTSVTLVLGGARSGKSTLAQKLAEERFQRPLYLATAEAFDEEMKERIALHRKVRGRRWRCVEAPLAIAKVIAAPPACDGILLDCITIWLSNVMFKEGDAAYERRRRELIAALKKRKTDVIIVSNEVGMGVVPDNELGRKFRDLAGWLNQDLARMADKVIFVVAGLPMVIKGEK